MLKMLWLMLTALDFFLRIFLMLIFQRFPRFFIPNVADFRTKTLLSTLKYSLQYIVYRKIIRKFFRFFFMEFCGFYTSFLLADCERFLRVLNATTITKETIHHQSHIFIRSVAEKNMDKSSIGAVTLFTRGCIFTQAKIRSPHFFYN